MNFIHIHEIEEAIESAARRLVPYESGQEYIYVDEEKSEFDYKRSGEFRRFVMAGKLLEHFLQKYRHHACAASLDGQIVRLSGHVVRPVIYNHSVDYSKKFARRIYLLYVDISTGKIDISGVAARLVDWLDDENSEFAELWQNDAASDFGDLNGWVICYPKDEVDASVSHLIELWDKRAKDAVEVDAKRGRPRRQEVAAKAYSLCFPEGHGSVPWKEVVTKLEVYGVNVSQKTLQRALDKIRGDATKSDKS